MQYSGFWRATTGSGRAVGMGLLIGGGAIVLFCLPLRVLCAALGLGLIVVGWRVLARR